MKEIAFVLSSLNDTHFKKRVEEFMNHGYQVKVYGFYKERTKTISGTKEVCPLAD